MLNRWENTFEKKGVSETKKIKLQKVDDNENKLLKWNNDQHNVFRPCQIRKEQIFEFLEIIEVTNWSVSEQLGEVSSIFKCNTFD